MPESEEASSHQPGNKELQEQVSNLSNAVVGLQAMLAQLLQKKFKSDSDSEDERPKHGLKKNKNDDDRGMKIDVQEFDGSLDPEVFLEWLRGTERVFEYKDFDDKKRFKIATLKLTKHASLWYENLKNKRQRIGKEKIESW